MTPWRVVFAPDSFKGSLTSVEVAEALAKGWRRARGDDELVLAPMADGGEGTLAAIEAGGGWEPQEVEATDPLGRPVVARWLRSQDGRRAVVELASASGLSRVSPDQRDPFAASTRGTGEVLCAVLDAGVRQIVLGIGGSATTDGGAGILEALGARVGADGVDLSGLDPRLAETDLLAATYGPQKGASPSQVRELDARLARFAAALEEAAGRQEHDTRGAGAAGGTAFGLLAICDRFARLELRPGVGLVIAETGLERKLAGSNLVVTGEGRIDVQTAYGKTALGVAQLATGSGVACIAVGGGAESEGIAALAELGVIVVPVVESP
ncbi:MAG: glycerate kinase, partial [Chloroflexi bacterium]